MRRTQQLIASCAYVLLVFSVSDCRCHSQDTDALHQVSWTISCSNELLNLSCNCAVVRDDAASIRIHNCNLGLTVNLACTDQSFVDICFPDSESHSAPIFGRSLHTQAAMVGDKFSLVQFCSYVQPPPCAVPICASSGNVEIAAPVSYVHLNQALGSRCGDLPGVSNDATSRELAKCQLRLWFHSCRLVSLFQGARSFACVVLWFSFASLVLASSRARLFLWVRTTCRAQVALLVPPCQQTASLLGF